VIQKLIRTTAATEKYKHHNKDFYILLYTVLWEALVSKVWHLKNWNAMQIEDLVIKNHMHSNWANKMVPIIHKILPNSILYSSIKFGSEKFIDKWPLVLAFTSVTLFYFVFYFTYWIGHNFGRLLFFCDLSHLVTKSKQENDYLVLNTNYKPSNIGKYTCPTRNNSHRQ